MGGPGQSDIGLHARRARDLGRLGRQPGLDGLIAYPALQRQDDRRRQNATGRLRWSPRQHTLQRNVPRTGDRRISGLDLRFAFGDRSEIVRPWPVLNVIGHFLDLIGHFAMMRVHETTRVGAQGHTIGQSPLPGSAGALMGKSVSAAASG